MDCDVGKVSHFLRFLDFGGRRWVVRTAYEQLGGWSCGLPSLAGDSRGLFWLWDVHCVAWAMAPAAVALCVGCARGVWLGVQPVLRVLETTSRHCECGELVYPR